MATMASDLDHHHGEDIDERQLAREKKPRSS
jgi:hypothetical protein